MMTAMLMMFVFVVAFMMVMVAFVLVVIVIHGLGFIDTSVPKIAARTHL